MYGRKVKLRFFFIVLILTILALSIYLVLKSLEENVVYFQSPSEIKNVAEFRETKIRIGGMVKKDSVSINMNEINFIITDFKNEINVIYSGAVPNLFEEGKSSTFVSATKTVLPLKTIIVIPNIGSPFLASHTCFNFSTEAA